MDRKNYAIGILSGSAALLALANYFAAAPSAVASDVLKDRDYSVATAPMQTGGDALYVIDNRTGMLGVFSYDTGQRQLVPRRVRPVADAFGGR